MEDKKPKKKRRGRGEGSITKRADGRWQATLDLGSDANGKRRRKVVYAQTRQEVQDKLHDEIAKKKSGLTNPTTETVKQWIGRYLDNNKSRWKPRTQRAYTYATDKHIYPAIGKLKLAKLKAIHIDRIYRDLESAGKIGAAAHVAQILKPALRKAKRLGMIATNPADDADAPSPRSSKGTTWTPDQADTFLQAVKVHRDYALFHTAIYTGLRLGELCALRWEHVRLNVAELDVKHTFGETSTDLLGTPKTASSERTVALPQSVVNILHERRKRSLAEGNGVSPWVFCAPMGGITWPQVIRGKAKTLMTDAGVPVIKFHEMRHFMPTSMLAADVNQKIVSRQLGHSSVKMTLDVYSHVSTEHQRQVSDAIDNLMKSVQAKRKLS